MRALNEERIGQVMLRRAIFFVIPAAVAVIASPLQPGEPFKPGKLPSADVAALQQGLTLRFYQGGKPLDARRVRLAALHVPAGDAPSPFVPPGPFVAKLSGYIKNPLKGDYSFRLVGNGTITLKINDKVVLKNSDKKDVEIELAKNYNKLEIDYVSPEKGDATLRLYWAGEKFGFEPVPPDVLSSRGDDKDLVEQTLLREGRQLYANRQCARCHVLPEPLKLADCKMPEMHDSGASLDDAGNRLQRDWLIGWILNPRAMRPDGTMPVVLAGADAPKQAADIAAFVLSLKKNPPPQPVSKAAKTADGEALFRRFACNSCHRLSDPKEKDDLERVPLHHVAAKYQQNALAHFLKQPDRHREWTRMPDFKLNDAEAGHLEAYLRSAVKGTNMAHPAGDVGRGEKLFRGVGCLNCHRIDDEKRFMPAFGRIESLDKGCLAVKDRGRAPDLGLSEAQRNAVATFVKTDRSSLTLESPAEFSLRQMQALQCASCHRRDGAITRWHTVLEDEGKEPEKLPSLTWTGEKLKPEWTQKMLGGTHDHRARPWIKARMPAFPARAEMLAVGLSHEHGFGVNEDERPKPDAELAAIGEKLIPQQGGFNCNNCHGIAKTPAIQPFEAPGINLLDAAVRLRYAYYQRWMLAPDRIDVVMRMPTFAADGKTTQLREVLDGDARHQFDALWHYIQTLPTKKN